MVTASVMIGSCEVGFMVCTPVSGIPKMMVSAPVVLLACSMAALSVQCPRAIAANAVVEVCVR